MKTKRTAFSVFFLFCSLFVTPQSLSVGIENGINFSNLRKDFDYNRFKSNSGPVNGLFVAWDFGNWFSLKSGINHTVYHVSEKNSSYYTPGYYFSPSSYWESSLSSAISSIYYHDYYSKLNFLRFPLLLTFKTPGRVQTEFGAGLYYAILTNDEYRGKDASLFDKEYRNEYFPPLNDHGFILYSSVGYQLSQKWNLFTSARVTYGKKEYFEQVKGRTGSTELIFGVGYKPFSNKIKQPSDSLGQKLSVIPHGGINISRTKSSKNKDKYKSSAGFSSGISLKVRLDKNVSVFSGAWYERKGYGLNYRGYCKPVYKETPQSQVEEAYQIESEIQLDYVTFPILFEIGIGKEIKSGINFGSYFSMLQNAFAQGETINKYQNYQGFNIKKNYFNDSLDEWFKTSDFGFMFGYQVSFPVFRRAEFNLAVNQSFGLTNIFNDDHDAISNHVFIASQAMHNNSTSLFFGFTIPVNNHETP